MCSSYPANIEVSESNKFVAECITSLPYTIVMASGESGSMGQIKEIARENGRELLIVGNCFQLARSTADIKISVKSTFERLEKIYENSDAILFLDGGIGMLSEFLSFLNNKIETDDEKPLIIYNKNGIFNFLLKDLEQRKKLGLIKDNYKEYFNEAKNLEDLALYLSKSEEFYNRMNEEKGKVK